MPANWPAELRRTFPRITGAQVQAFADLLEQDRLIDDAGKPTPELIKWSEGVTA